MLDRKDKAVSSGQWFLLLSHWLGDLFLLSFLLRSLKMSAQIISVTAPAAQWTLLSTGYANVQLRLQTPLSFGSIRLGTSAPTLSPSDDPDWIQIGKLEVENFNFSDTTTNVYFWPWYHDTVVKVVVE